jgi:hypothetical protein
MILAQHAASYERKYQRPILAGNLNLDVMRQRPLRVNKQVAARSDSFLGA